MSMASEFRDAARGAKAAYEVLGRSGAAYIFFWFDDGSVVAARRAPTDNAAMAGLVFGQTKPALDDCGLDDCDGTTYQKGAELLRRLEAA